ncbi:Beta-D-glucosyl crocetin beta-1,6-glucosyltransferase [Sesamum alatum]|uniref:Glycosyltransferase n=1 Tax=Sesamum alatum TaxID=300844 RepID=A0AAE1YJ21_9LAMI|nr:Beta-D-glucosyl crocetin beta-1,6-glucosyltransferase [Sesamum alatum]
MDTRKRSTRILMFPWLAHGHISPFLELAKSLSKRNFVTYICSSPVNLNSIRKNLSSKDSISVKLVELHIPTTPELPPHYHTTNGLPPHLMPSLKRALDRARPAFSTILQTLKPDLVLYDFLHSWAPEEAQSQNIPVVVFLSTGAAATSLIILEYPFPGIYFREHEYGNFCRLAKSTGSDTNDSLRFKDCIRRSCDVILIKTFRELEGQYVDFLSDLTRKRCLPVGPLVQEVGCEMEDEGNDIMEWLDRKDRRSTVFASFGSEYFLSANEVEEIAHGLELSGLNFIWVVRFPRGGEKIKIEEKLPEGFLGRVEGRGWVVEGWAPQRKILSHPSVGGFLSHCGWSSVMEGMYSGVPIIAVPMHLDQPLNARLVEAVGFGEEVVRSREGNLDRGEVARVVKKVVVGKSGEGLRRRVEELSGKMREEGKEEIDSVVEELATLVRRRERSDLSLRSENSMTELHVMIMKNREGMLSENT